MMELILKRYILLQLMVMVLVQRGTESRLREGQLTTLALWCGICRYPVSSFKLLPEPYCRGVLEDKFKMTMAVLVVPRIFVVFVGCGWM